MFDFRPPPSHHIRKADELAFDGNHNDLVVDWCVPKLGVTRLSLEDVESMFVATVEGHLAWVCVPPAGFRL